MVVLGPALKSPPIDGGAPTHDTPHVYGEGLVVQLGRWGGRDVVSILS